MRMTIGNCGFETALPMLTRKAIVIAVAEGGINARCMTIRNCRSLDSRMRNVSIAEEKLPVVVTS